MSIVEDGADAPELFAPDSLSTASAASAPKVSEEPPEPLRGQSLLGVDKRNPCISVYEDATGQRLLVYYGLEFFESVKNDREDPAYKLLLGRLYNARINLSVLSQTFAVDPKTIRRWGKALLQGDAVELIRVLEGRGAGRKRTPGVEKFARLRWPSLVAEGSYGAVGRLLQEIESVFEVTAGLGAERFYTREPMARAWIVQWRRHRVDSPIRDCDLRPHILPWRWSSERVLDYMRCVFWNSALWTPFESLNRVNEREPLGILVQNNGTWLLYGDATCLIAYPVKDLRITRTVLGKIVMEWTTPANIAVDRESGRLLRVGKPAAERYELGD